MARRRPVEAPRWTERQLEKDRLEALAAFIRERGQEGTRAYRTAFEELEPVVRRLFEVTKDLRDFHGSVIRKHPELLPAARYLAGPPISADDLETLVGGRLGRRVPEPDVANRVAEGPALRLGPHPVPMAGE
jgi:hypothetical protein